MLSLGPMLLFFKYFRWFFRRKYMTQNKAKLCKILIITLVFEKKRQFLAQNCQKSQKFVIITSTPGHPERRAEKMCRRHQPKTLLWSSVTLLKQKSGAARGHCPQSKGGKFQKEKFIDGGKREIRQCDQMSLWKNRLMYVGMPTTFKSNLIQNLYRGKREGQYFALLLYFSKIYPKKVIAQSAKIRPIWSPCK
jgi:hypothetical protein